MSSKDKTQSNWHPDFKIESTLPDIKIIRTDFAIKSVVLVLVIISSALLMQREYRSYLLRSSINDLEQQVQNNSIDNAARLGKSEKFRNNARNIQELQQFFQVPFFAHESMVELALLKPEDVIFSRVALAESITAVQKGKKTAANSKLVFKVDIKGDVHDLQVLTGFKRMLEESLLFNPSGFEVNVDESIQQRDVNTGIIPFQITVKLVSAEE